jgi:hypothetical protein
MISLLLCPAKCELRNLSLNTKFLITCWLMMFVVHLMNSDGWDWIISVITSQVECHMAHFYMFWKLWSYFVLTLCSSRISNLPSTLFSKWRQSFTIPTFSTSAQHATWFSYKWFESGPAQWEAGTYGTADIWFNYTKIKLLLKVCWQLNFLFQIWGSHGST